MDTRRVAKGVALAAVLGMAAPAGASGLVEGGYLAGMLASDGGSDVAAGSGSVDLGSGLTLSFTPRDTWGVTSFSRADGGGGGTLRLSLVPADDTRSRLENLDLAFRPALDTGRAARLEADAVELGGAFEFRGWSLGGSLVELSDLDGDTRIYGATLGYGPVAARLAFGRADRATDTGDREIWQFSNNLPARSWL